VNQTLSSPVVVCRPALPCDKTDVLEFTKFTWDGGDYIRYVWDDWMADPHGLLAAAEYGGRCVGIAKASLSAPGQWWLEGFRVDPELQGGRIGSHIHDYIHGWWLEHGDGVLRFMTSSRRVKVHHLAEKLGFEKILEMVELEAPVLDEPCESFQPVQGNEIRESLGFASNSPQMNAANGLIDVGWSVIHADEEVLTEMQRRGLALWWRGRQGLLLIWQDGGDEGGFSLPACGMQSLPALLHDARQLAAQRGYDVAFWIAPLTDEIMSAAEAAGYAPHKNHTIFLYAKAHPARP
jgi:GNAT superfamily N-acetyltransferase